jgi:protein arginine N-methyltransferase 5
MRNFLQLAGAEKPCFEFRHPAPQPADNRRYRRVAFDAFEQAATVHGFAGTFDCLLYGDVHISIAPKTFSEGMFSWFPVFIPLKEPVRVEKGDVLDTHWWRHVDPRNVWYSWAVTGPDVVSTHNVGGRAHKIGL